MTISLTLPDLLRQIQADQVDADIDARCQEAERLCRRGEFNASLAHVRATVESASQLGVPLNIGVAFLHLASIRHSTPRKDAHDQAPRDAETAVKWLKRDAHHALIAHLVCARIFVDDDQMRPALRHYRAAQTLAMQLITYWHRRNKPDKENYYKDIRDVLSAAVRELQPPSAAEAESPASTEGQPAQRQTSEGSTENAGDAGASAGDTSPVFHLKQQNPSQEFMLDSYEISRVWINGQEYLVETVNPVDPQQPGLRLQSDQKYLAVLVNEEGQPAEGQIPADGEAVQLRVWTETEEAIEDQAEAKFVGAVEARLRLAPAPPLKPEIEIDDNLLDCIDDLFRAINAGRKPDPGLMALYKKFLNYLRRTYDLRVIPITPRRTKFDPQAGHVPVETKKNARLPDDVITQVVRQGYTRDGTIVREAHVVVNRR